MRCAALLLLASFVTAEPLRDNHPLVSTGAVLYLDGPDWTATGTTRDFNGSCTFEPNTDLNPGVRLSCCLSTLAHPVVRTPAGCYTLQLPSMLTHRCAGAGVKATPIAYNYNAPPTGGGQNQCCLLCAASVTCAASVWDGTSCMFKSAADLNHKVASTGHTACLPGTTSRPITINASVPGDLVTDLERAGLVEDPLRGTNYANASIWGGPMWTFSKTFDLPATFTDPGATTLLVFEGIKMGAQISINGHELGNATNQHRRMVFPVKQLQELSRQSDLGAKQFTLTVKFDDSITTEGRYMNCAGGWDWAPYSRMRDADGNPMFTKGIWRSLYALAVPDAVPVAISHVAPLVYYSGTDWPTAAMDDGTAPFTVVVRVHILVPESASASGTIFADGSWGDGVIAAATNVSLVQGQNEVNVTLQAQSPKLWWPNGMGAQPLYNVSVRFQHANGQSTQNTSRQIGFRFVAMVTGNDTNKTWVAEHRHSEGNGDHTMMFRVNGASVVARGANFIPMETLEGRYVHGMHQTLVQSTADAGFNMLRVWGGGIYPLDEFFDACDRLGIMIYQDMMYGTDGIMPGAAATTLRCCPSNPLSTKHCCLVSLHCCLITAACHSTDVSLSQLKLKLVG